MQIIPTQPLARQSLQVTLDGQNASLTIYQTAYGLFMDVYLNGSIVAAGVICENLNRIVRSLYLGFQGDLVFIDTAGAADPLFTGLGSQWVLAYFSQPELVGLS